MENTTWKKNIDSRYISGEDLQNSVKGLRPEMIVFIDKYEDAEFFDQNKQEKRIGTGFFLKEPGGRPVYKPCLLNKTNAKVLDKEFGTDQMAQWVGKPFIMYAQKDSRHGFVVRFKKFSPPLLIIESDNFNACKKAIQSGHSIDQIKLKYHISPEAEKALLL